MYSTYIECGRQLSPGRRGRVARVVARLLRLSVLSLSIVSIHIQLCWERVYYPTFTYLNHLVMSNDQDQRYGDKTSKLYIPFNSKQFAALASKKQIVSKFPSEIQISVPSGICPDNVMLIFPLSGEHCGYTQKVCFVKYKKITQFEICGNCKEPVSNQEGTTYIQFVEHYSDEYICGAHFSSEENTDCNLVHACDILKSVK
jgi:hypothetical protein